MIFVMDASSLIAFYSENELNEPLLLHKLVDYGYSLIVPIAVVNEIKKGRRSTFSVLTRAITERKITICHDFSADEVSSLSKRYPELHEGEIQVLLLGMKYKKSGEKYCCVLDEGPARSIAEKKAISKKGTKGLIDMLNEIGIITDEEKENLLNRLKQSTFRIKL